MTSPADADAPAPAQRGGDSGFGAKIALGVVVFILVVLFVLPGFVAAGFSRTGVGFFSVNGSGWSGINDPPAIGSTFMIRVKPPFRLRAERIILAPSAWLMKHSRPIRRFYMWQFRTAGGVAYEIEF